MPPRTPAASIAKRALNSPAACSPASVTSSDATDTRCANSVSVEATWRPVWVPVRRASVSTARSSGCTFCPAASATCETVARKSSSSRRMFESAALRSFSVKPRPVATIWRSAVCPASADLRSASSRPWNASASDCRTSLRLDSAPSAMPSLTARTTSLTALPSRRRLRSASSVRSCTLPRMSTPARMDSLVRARISSGEGSCGCS